MCLLIFQRSCSFNASQFTEFQHLPLARIMHENISQSLFSILGCYSHARRDFVDSQLADVFSELTKLRFWNSQGFELCVKFSSVVYLSA